MAGSKAGSGKRRKTNKKSSNTGPLLFGFIAAAAVGGIGWGVYQFLPRGEAQAATSVSAPETPYVPVLRKSHEEHLAALLAAQREFGKVMHSVADGESARKALPQVGTTMSNVTHAANDWLAYINLHPMSRDEAAKLAAERTRQVQEIFKEFPDPTMPGSRAEVTMELRQLDHLRNDNARDLTTLDMAFLTAAQSPPGTRQISAGYTGNLTPANSTP